MSVSDVFLKDIQKKTYRNKISTRVKANDDNEDDPSTFASFKGVHYGIKNLGKSFTYC